MIKRFSTQYHALFEQVRDPLLFVEEGGKIREVNPAARAVLDLGKGRDIRDVASLEGSFHFDADMILPLLSKPRPVYGVRLNNAEGNPSDVTIDILDLDKTRGRSQTRVIHIKDTSCTQPADKSRDELLTLVAHEIKNPLAAIKNSLATLVSQDPGPLTHDQHKLLATSERSIDRLTRLLDGLLDVSRANTGKYVPVPEWVDTLEYFDDVLGSFQTLYNARKIAVDMHVSSELERIYVDAPKTEQVLINLLSNAVRFSKDGGTIQVSVEPAGIETLDDDARILPWREFADPKFVRIVVRDSGIGMNEDTLANLYTRHYNDGKTPGDTGSHLGLGIAKTLVESHNGRLEVKSELGVGTEVSVALPRDDATFEALRRLASISRCLARVVKVQKGGHFYALRKDPAMSWEETIASMRRKPLMDPDLRLEQDGTWLGWPLAENVAVFLLVDDTEAPSTASLFGLTINDGEESAHHVEGHTTAACRVPADGTRLTKLLNVALKRLQRPAPVWSRA